MNLLQRAKCLFGFHNYYDNRVDYCLECGKLKTWINPFNAKIRQHLVDGATETKDLSVVDFDKYEEGPEEKILRRRRELDLKSKIKYPEYPEVTPQEIEEAQKKYLPPIMGNANLPNPDVLHVSNKDELRNSILEVIKRCEDDKSRAIFQSLLDNIKYL